MLLVGEDPKKFINDYSRQFQRDFLQLLRTAHGEKKVHMNNFYQEYIRDKEHIHMNATKWPSMTEFAKHLGREGICRVEEGDRGLEIQWIDDSAEAIRRREDVRRKERLVKGDEDVESRLLEQQIRRAREAEAAKVGSKPETTRPEEGDTEKTAHLEPIKVSVSLKAKGAVKPTTTEAPAEDAPIAIESFSTVKQLGERPAADTAEVPKQPAAEEPAKPEAPVKMSLSLAKKKPVNPLAKKNPFAKKKDAFVPEPEKKMSNAERIMKEELERKRAIEERGNGGAKRPRFN